MDGYGVRVLVADDCDETREKLTLLLALDNYNVHVATDGGEALRQMNRRRYNASPSTTHAQCF